MLEKQKALAARIKAAQETATQIYRSSGDDCCAYLIHARNATDIPAIRANLRTAETLARALLGDIQAALVALDKA